MTKELRDDSFNTIAKVISDSGIKLTDRFDEDKASNTYSAIALLKQNVTGENFTDYMAKVNKYSGVLPKSVVLDVANMKDINDYLNLEPEMLLCNDNQELTTTWNILRTFTSTQINNSNITASFISSSGFISASSLSSNIIITNTGSFAYFTSSNILLNPNGGIFITSSDGTKGGSIYLDNLGNLQFTSVSGSVFLGKGTGDIYIGDGSSSANIIFDQGGIIKAGDNITLNIGSAASFIEATGSSITFQRGGGNVIISGSLIASSSRVFPTSSGTPSFTGADGQFIFGSSGGNHFIYVWMSGAWRSSSLS
jgi:hypothetical protein